MRRPLESRDDRYEATLTARRPTEVSKQRIIIRKERLISVMSFGIASRRGTGVPNPLGLLDPLVAFTSEPHLMIQFSRGSLRG
jgi:hypothetical protein